MIDDDGFNIISTVMMEEWEIIEGKRGWKEELWERGIETGGLENSIGDVLREHRGDHKLIVICS